jgi:hypothetical protein
MRAEGREAIARPIREKIAQHEDNLALWESGYLDPTEPDEDERRATIAGLRAASGSLRWALAIVEKGGE